MESSNGSTPSQATEKAESGGERGLTALWPFGRLVGQAAPRSAASGEFGMRQFDGDKSPQSKITEARGDLLLPRFLQALRLGAFCRNAELIHRPSQHCQS